MIINFRELDIEHTHTQRGVQVNLNKICGFLVILTIVLQNVATRENWVKDV